MINLRRNIRGLNYYLLILIPSITTLKLRTLRMTYSPTRLSSTIPSMTREVLITIQQTRSWSGSLNARHTDYRSLSMSGWDLRCTHTSSRSRLNLAPLSRRNFGLKASLRLLHAHSLMRHIRRNFWIRQWTMSRIVDSELISIVFMHSRYELFQALLLTQSHLYIFFPKI